MATSICAPNLYAPVESDKRTLALCEKSGYEQYLASISPAVNTEEDLVPAASSYKIPPYFWGATYSPEQASSIPRSRGYTEERDLAGDGSQNTWSEIVDGAFEAIRQVFEAVGVPTDQIERSTNIQGTKYSPGKVEVTTVKLSDELETWRNIQFNKGFILPAKGYGIRPEDKDVLKILGAQDWPAPLVSKGAFFGSVFGNLLIGAYDARTLYSNFCCDMAFYYEHGYAEAFPAFEPVLRAAILEDSHSMNTPGGRERREAALSGLVYIKGKVELESRADRKSLTGKTARFDRRTAQIVSFAENSLGGMLREAVFRGFDPAGVFADTVFTSPETDVLDIGSDLMNGEVCNSFLNTADLGGAENGIITEEALRRVYDAYAHSCARIFTERWAEPTARVAGQLYIWHMLNDRHSFFRRAVLGHAKARKLEKPDQREGDLDEVFDEDFHTTGFSRPLENACNGQDPCDHVTQFLSDSRDPDLLTELWLCAVTRPVEYTFAGVVDEVQERNLGSKLAEVQVKAYSQGYVAEMSWLIEHAAQHAWQVNYMMEAAMFGSLLDDGGHKGKFDRYHK